VISNTDKQCFGYGLRSGQLKRKERISRSEVLDVLLGGLEASYQAVPHRGR
jgi:hypothetical protein